MQPHALPRLTFGVEREDTNGASDHAAGVVWIQLVSRDQHLALIPIPTFPSLRGIDIEPSVVVGKHPRVTRAKRCAVGEDKIAEQFKGTERTIRDIERTEPAREQKFALPRHNGGTVFRAIRLGAVMLPILKILAHPSHAVAGIQIPFSIVIKNRGIADRAIIGIGIARGLVFMTEHTRLTAVPFVLSPRDIGDRQGVAPGVRRRAFDLILH